MSDSKASCAKVKDRSEDSNREHLIDIDNWGNLNFQPDVVIIGTSMSERVLWQDDAKRAYQNSDLKKYKVSNFGVGGDKICNMMWRVKNGELYKYLKIGLKKGQNPLFILEAGANDVEQIKANKMLEHFDELYQYTKKMFPECKIAIIGLRPRTSKFKTPSKLMKELNRFNELISEKYDNVYNTGSNLIGEDGFINPKFLMANDPVHLNYDGYVLFLQDYKKAIEDLTRS